jgi:hypothetical protein
MTKANRTAKDIARALASKEWRARRDSDTLRLEIDIDPHTVTEVLLDGGLIEQSQVKNRVAVAAAVLHFLKCGSKLRITCDSVRCRGRLCLEDGSLNPER